MSIRGSKHIRPSVPYSLGQQQLVNESLRIRNYPGMTEYDDDIIGGNDYYMPASNSIWMKYFMVNWSAGIMLVDTVSPHILLSAINW